MKKIYSEKLIEKLKNANKVTVLTGAGVSAESGVPTFRDKDGLWDKFNPQELANMNAFMKNPELVWEWYKWRQDLISRIKPNAGHYALAELEKIMTDSGRQFTLVTQNVDGLHKKAGSKNIFELHGNIMRIKCLKCNYFTSEIDAFSGQKIPRCPTCGQMLRPDVVWFGEMLPEYEISKSFEASENCDVFFSVGTSAVVYPAAMLPVHAKNDFAFVVEINPEKSAIAHNLDEVILGKSGEVLPLIVKEVMGKKMNNE
jgi:NAD-dependent deacetylase